MDNDEYQDLINNILIEIKKDYVAGSTKTRIRLSDVDRDIIEILEEDLSSRGYKIEFKGDYVIIYHPKQKGFTPAELRELIEKIDSDIRYDFEEGKDITRKKLKDKERDADVKEALENYYTDRDFGVEFMGNDIVLTHPEQED